MKAEFMQLYQSVKKSALGIMSIKEGSDIQSTTEGIKRDISFRGPTAWILIFSIFIASIGLNVNSTAVIIGAMLISPLMGPILGIGFSIGTFDIETLVKSLKNLGIAVGISLLTSTLYFMLSPLNVESSELLARTKPTLLDVLVALFGGFAGIIAGSRKEKTNVIPGVAIATALMPPLCTAGYGLATMNMKFFLGAFYLFFINSVFISLSTFLIVKYLDFPTLKTPDVRIMKRYRRIFFSIIIITVIPSTWIFYKVIQETRFNVNAERFVTEKCNFSGSELINHRISYSDTLSVINLYYIGDRISAERKEFLSEMLPYYNISGKERLAVTSRTEIRIHQDEQENINYEQRFAELNDKMRMKILEDIYSKNEEIVKDKDTRIKLLENEVLKLRKDDSIPFYQINNELNFQFTSVQNFSYGRIVEYNITDSVQYDTIPVFLVRFTSGINERKQQSEIEKLQSWLKIRLNNPKLRVVPY